MTRHRHGPIGSVGPTGRAGTRLGEVLATKPRDEYVPSTKVGRVIPGATRPSRIAEDTAALDETIPAAFWTDLRAAGLVSPDAPLPRHA